jgi:hypothetical protein
MEGLARLVNDSLARHGIEPKLDHRRLKWSQWFRCESSFSLVLVPGKPGLYVLAEELHAATADQRMHRLFRICAADDLAVALGRMFQPGSPERDHMNSGRCFARFAVIEDAIQRGSALSALQHWISQAAETASGISNEFGLETEYPELGCAASRCGIGAIGRAAHPN